MDHDLTVFTEAFSLPFSDCPEHLTLLTDAFYALAHYFYYGEYKALLKRLPIKSFINSFIALQCNANSNIKLLQS